MTRNDETTLSKIVEIRCESPEEALRVATSIHEQLVGNTDYINNEILLHFSDEDDVYIGEPNRVWLYISDKVKTMPDITLKLIKEERKDGKQEN